MRSCKKCQIALIIKKKQTSIANTLHGCSGKNITPEYKTWKRMWQRCRNKNLPHYGEKGIAVCDRWLSFENFLEDMGRRPDGKTIDRINGNLGYSPENCRWATRTQQQRNLKTNRFFDYMGSKMTIAEISEKVLIKYTTLHRRLSNGMTIEDAINKPIKGSK